MLFNVDAAIPFNLNSLIVVIKTWNQQPGFLFCKNKISRGLQQTHGRKATAKSITRLLTLLVLSVSQIRSYLSQPSAEYHFRIIYNLRDLSTKKICTKFKVGIVPSTLWKENNNCIDSYYCFLSKFLIHILANCRFFFLKISMLHP